MSAILLQTLGCAKSPSLACFEAYREEEKTGLQSSVGRDGKLRDYEDLELRINPTQVEIDNESDERCTLLKVDSANRPGTLVEVCFWAVYRAPSCIIKYLCMRGGIVGPLYHGAL
jgi:hypothetical protein